MAMSQGDTTVAKVTTNFHPRVNSYIKMTAYSILCVRLWGRACLLFCSVILTLVQVLHLLGCLRSEVTFIASQKSYQGNSQQILSLWSATFSSHLLFILYQVMSQIS